METKLFVTVPSIYRELIYNTYTKEVLYEGKVYAHIENKIYTQTFLKKPGKHVYWDKALISYFHPILLVIISPNYRAEISCKKIYKIGLTNNARKKYIGKIYTEEINMKIYDNRPYHN